MPSPIAHGVDLVDIARIARIRERHGERFLDRVFTERERAYALESRKADERLAARFAAKEAVMKALGTGLASGIRWTDVEVLSTDTGAPAVILHNRAEEIAGRLGVRRFLISLSHTRAAAMASVIALGNPAPSHTPP